jgi:Luciferase
MNAILYKIHKEIIKWTGVTAEPRRFRDIEFSLNKRELGQHMVN